MLPQSPIHVNIIDKNSQLWATTAQRFAAAHTPLNSRFPVSPQAQTNKYKIIFDKDLKKT